jgi:hypothetical protein
LSSTSIIKFTGNDYDLIACSTAIAKYCMKCKDNNVSVVLYCPSVKIVDTILLRFNLFEKITKTDPDEDYTFTRTIEKPRFSNIESNTYLKKVYRALKLEFIENEYWFNIDYPQSTFLSNIKMCFGKRAFNIISFSENFFSSNSLDLNISMINLVNSGRSVVSVGSAEFGEKCIDFRKLNLIQFCTIMSCSNMFFGQDSLFSQIAFNIGIPCYIISSVGGTCRIKQKAGNVIYGKRAHLTPITVKKIDSWW